MNSKTNITEENKVKIGWSVSKTDWAFGMSKGLGLGPK